MNKKKNRLYELLRAYILIRKALRVAGIVRSERNLTCELGEWLAAKLCHGKIADNNTQTDWDIQDQNGRKIQVKTHSKAVTNKNRWTKINKIKSVDIDELILIIFTPGLVLKEYYRAPWDFVCKKIKYDKGNYKIYWNALLKYQIDIKRLNCKKTVQLFS